MFEIRPTIGTTYTNAFEFIDFDPSSGCFSNVNHCLNTSNRTSDYVWYTFELNHRRSIEMIFPRNHQQIILIPVICIMLH